MSEETNQQPTEHPFQNTPEQPSEPKRDYQKIFIAVIALLVIAIVFLLVRNSKLSNKLEVAQTDYAISDSSRRAVESDYQAALVRLDELVSKNAQMDSLLSNRNSEIAKLRKQIDAIISDKNATAEQLGKAKRLIAKLNGKVQTYEERIASLESDNSRLGKENELLQDERDATVADNIGLQQQVRLGSVLHASNIRMVPINLKRGGKKQKETERAKKVDVLRIMFDIDENRIIETGLQEIFLRITGPQGKILSNAAYGSGVTTTYDDQPLNYTLSKQIEIAQNTEENDLIVDWNQDSDYARGTYKIELYHNGYQIGSGKVTLK